ncbi:MAG: hypothetical protein EXR21_02990 [Flavobacteriaceae bacterium]|nr:hypothetical protein [Flavobacteriaceae bacterium]
MNKYGVGIVHQTPDKKYHLEKFSNSMQSEFTIDFDMEEGYTYADNAVYKDETACLIFGKDGGKPLYRSFERPNLTDMIVLVVDLQTKKTKTVKGVKFDIKFFLEKAITDGQTLVIIGDEALENEKFVQGRSYVPTVVSVWLDDKSSQVKKYPIEGCSGSYIMDAVFESKINRVSLLVRHCGAGILNSGQIGSVSSVVHIALENGKMENEDPIAIPTTRKNLYEPMSSKMFSCKDGTIQCGPYATRTEGLYEVYITEYLSVGLFISLINDAKQEFMTLIPYSSLDKYVEKYFSKKDRKIEDPDQISPYRGVRFLKLIETYDQYILIGEAYKSDYGYSNGYKILLAMEIQGHLAIGLSKTGKVLWHEIVDAPKYSVANFDGNPVQQFSFVYSDESAKVATFNGETFVTTTLKNGSSTNSIEPKSLKFKYNFESTFSHWYEDKSYMYGIKKVLDPKTGKKVKAIFVEELNLNSVYKE